MSLADWQRELAARVSAPRGSTRPEDRRAAAIADSAGLRLTRTVQRTWRRTRLWSALPLTMAALPAALRVELLEGYCDACPCVSFFPLHEARDFVRFLADQPRLPRHVRSIAALEVAVADALEAGVFDDAEERPAVGRLRLRRGAARIVFFAPPERLLAHALAGLELPDAGEQLHELLVAPGISGLARAPTAEERRLLDTCDGAGRFVDSHAELPEPAHALLAERVLTLVPAA